MYGISRQSVSQTGNVGNHQLICDTFPLKITRKDRVMKEDVHGDKVSVLRIGGQLQRAGRPNANGRIYPTNVLRQAVEEIQEDVNSRRVLGEFDHPPDAKIHLDRVSHLITKLWMEGDTVFGECEVLEHTTHGRQLKALFEANVNIGISSRGVGDMESTIHEGEEYYQVLPGYTFVTFDIVAEPSVYGSYMSVLESKNTFSTGRRNHRKVREEQVVTEMRDFFKKLRGKK
jgi:hypothetical protein